MRKIGIRNYERAMGVGDKGIEGENSCGGVCNQYILEYSIIVFHSS